MINKTGLYVKGPAENSAVPSSMKEILLAYDEAGLSLMEELKAKWTDKSLEESDEMYGNIWKRGFTLTALIAHQTHHRGQMTVFIQVG